MYAIIETGGKQYRAVEGEIFDVELLDLKDGETVEFPALFVSNEENYQVGAPHVEGCVVVCRIVEKEIKGEKIISYKFKRRKNYHRKIGHRQRYTRIQIEKIQMKATAAA